MCPGSPDIDSDNDGTLDCKDGCPNDSNKTDPGQCGCGVADTDTDGDATADCHDGCPTDPNKTSPGTCGCGRTDSDNCGFRGCTPGYWKQDQHFDSWPAGYAPGMLFTAIPGLDDAFAGLTLLQVLELNGGGLNALGRHTVAALLNAASGGVDYDLTEDQVKAAFNAVYPGGDYESVKNRFEALNEQGCPLD